MTLQNLLTKTEEKFEKELKINCSCKNSNEACNNCPSGEDYISFLRQAQLDVVEWYEKRFLEIYEAVDKATKEDKDNLLIDKIAGLYMETCISTELNKENK